MNKKEIWKPVPGFVGIYEVSSFGRVKSFQHVGCNRGIKYRGIILRPDIRQIGYCQIRLCKNGKHKKFYVHRLVLMAFRGPPGLREEAAHLDGNARNNHIENLAWVSRRENCSHKIAHGTSTRGIRHGRAKLVDKDVLKIRAMYESGARLVEIAKLYSVTYENIRAIAKRINWKHI